MPDINRPKTVDCARCGKRTKVAAKGRVPVYCSPNCKAMASAKRKDAARKSPPPLPPEERLRGMLWELLTNAGVVKEGTPLPPRKTE